MSKLRRRTATTYGTFVPCLFIPSVQAVHIVDCAGCRFETASLVDAYVYRHDIIHKDGRSHSRNGGRRSHGHARDKPEADAWASRQTYTCCTGMDLASFPQQPIL